MPFSSITVIKFFILFKLLEGTNFGGHESPVLLKLVNLAGIPVDLYWQNTNNNESIKLTTRPLHNSSESTFNSYNGHHFSVKPTNGQPVGEAKFVIASEEEVITIVKHDEGIVAKRSFESHTASESLVKATKDCSHFTGDSLRTCITKKLYKDIERITDSKSQLIKYRDLISSRLRNYTCADENANSGPPISSYGIQLDGKEYTVNKYFDTSHAKILTIDDFISDEECSILEKYGGPRLQRATVAAEDGSSTVSNNRRAQQAGYELHSSEDPLWGLYNKILDFTNSYNPTYNLQPEGQEGFTIIQYNPGDEYTPHCDGSCDGSPHNPGGRVATAVAYCQAAGVGGATTFTKADVMVRPKRGRVAFFSYVGADGHMDDGLTEHSACPIIQGEKWIAVFWMRIGVTSERPWTVFDPSGIPIEDDSNMMQEDDTESCEN